MSKKTIAELYNNAHATVAAHQNKRYGNPLTTAPAHVPDVLEQAARNRVISKEQARKLASELGRKSYGEWGLSSGVVSAILDRIIGRHEIPWQAKAELEMRICE